METSELSFVTAVGRWLQTLALTAVLSDYLGQFRCVFILFSIATTCVKGSKAMFSLVSDLRLSVT